jgi:Zn-dependent peptidase ImmA (M78 family)
MNNFASRFKSARLRKGLSIQQLADLLVPKLTKQAISRYELGLSTPPMEKLLQLCDILDVRPDYFLREVQVQFGEIAYRKLVRFTPKEQEKVIEHARDQLERDFELYSIVGEESHFENPLPKIYIENIVDAEAAANQIRERWNLGMQPLSNVIELLEGFGIKVAVVEASRDFNGFATWVNENIPVIVLNSKYTEFPDRKRFTALHELGHLVLPISHLEEKEQERMCNRFAAALLLPAKALRKELGEKRNHLLLPEIGSIKQQFGISIQAIVYRTNDLGITSDAFKKAFIQQFKNNGFLEKEPVDYDYCGKEESYRFKQLVFKALAEGFVTQSKAAGLMNMKLADFRETFKV